jgi:N-acetylglucosaminyl-diphospho-decaprenol L-rhamnosyltransferase
LSAAGPADLGERGAVIDPAISGVVVHWRAADELRELVAAWPAETRYELLVVDNDGSAALAERDAARVRLLRPGRNLGFAGGVNLGVEAARAPWVLLLNPDARPESGALAALEAATRRHPEAAGLVPRLRGLDGAPQHRWQLRPLPRLDQLLRQAFFVPGPAGPRVEPAAGATIEQPAAAALLLSRDRLRALGGLDERFHPAWFEDVDLARRWRAAGLRFVYAPQSDFRHRLGGSLGALGYGGFLRAYNRNLARYLRKHHGASAAWAMRALVPLGAALRLLALPLRRPRRTADRREAARALVGAALDALRGFPEDGR